MAVRLLVRKWAAALVVCMMAAGICAYILRVSGHPVARASAASTKELLFSGANPPTHEMEGLGGILSAECYQDNRPVPAECLDRTRDVKVVYRADGCQRLINYPDGYLVDLPPEFSFDFRYSPIYTRASSSACRITISREWSPYPDVQEYCRLLSSQIPPERRVQGSQRRKTCGGKG